MAKNQDSKFVPELPLVMQIIEQKESVLLAKDHDHQWKKQVTSKRVNMQCPHGYIRIHHHKVLQSR